TIAPKPTKSEVKLETPQPLDPNVPMSEQEAQITSVTGKSVQYTVDDGATWKQAQKGVKLSHDAAVRTGFASRCEVSFQGLTVLIVEPLSSVKIAEYLGAPTAQKVQANLQYGAVRAGVEKGRIKSDTRISTAVSTLSIRGTLVYVEYDRGTRRCRLKVEKDGPALARAARGEYLLDEEMDTDCSLSRYLDQAVFRHHVWLTGDVRLGYDSEGINESLAHYGNTPTFEEGGKTFNNPRSVTEQQPPSDYIYPGDDIPIGNYPAG
ncbi:MAG: FecR domain-containing protein, partial [Sedimentisphaerales bacterium]|nr:FecR domain-containing protein [Sedimentisphaerales bacterium]